MKEDKTKIVAIVLAILAIVVVVISVVLKQEKKQDIELSVVKNPSEFFTVNSCLYRVTTYLSNKDTNSLIKVLDDSYKKKNKINKDNVLDVFPKIAGEVTFVSKKMYYEEINKNIKKYYVKGNIQLNIIHDYTKVESEELNDIYFIVVINSKKQIFSIEPYDGKIFMDGEKNE